MLFLNRRDAAQKLIHRLKKYQENKDVVILGLPRGGVVLAAEIANDLNVPLDIIVSRKIGAPQNPELAIGSLTQEGNTILNEELVATLNIPQSYIDQKVQEEIHEIHRRLKLYRNGKNELDLKGKIAILVDDGIATGSTMFAAIKSTKAKDAKKIIVAVPVASLETIKKIEHEVDEVICLYTPENFMSIGSFYEFFDQVDDAKVIELMKKNK
jgi:putative phosphoribosyl transferase